MAEEVRNTNEVSTQGDANMDNRVVQKDQFINIIKSCAEIFGCIGAVLVCINMVAKEFEAIIKSKVYDIPMKYFSLEDYRTTMLIIIVIIIFCVAIIPFFFSTNVVNVFSGILFLLSFVNVFFCYPLLLGEVESSINKEMLKQNAESILKDTNLIFRMFAFNKINIGIVILLVLLSVIISGVLRYIFKRPSKDLAKVWFCIFGGYLVALAVIIGVFKYMVIVNQPLESEKRFEIMVDNTNTGNTETDNANTADTKTDDIKKVDVVITEYDGKLVIMKGSLKNDNGTKTLDIYKKTSNFLNSLDSNYSEYNDYRYMVIDRDDNQKFDYITVDKVEFKQ